MCIVWMLHLSVKKPMAYGIGNNRGGTPGRQKGFWEKASQEILQGGYDRMGAQYLSTGN